MEAQEAQDALDASYEVFGSGQASSQDLVAYAIALALLVALIWFSGKREA